VTRAAHPWWLGPAAVLGATLLRLVGRTWRLERIGTAEVDGRIRAVEPCLFAFWHARLLALTFDHRHRGHAVLISRHRDGELIARIIERLGYETARGSSTRGGEEGTREMLRFAEQGLTLGLTPDGPRGPAEQVKPGIVYLASRTGLPVVPVSAAAARDWRARSWDRFRFPWPFTRVVVGYGAPIRVPPQLDESQLEAWRVRIEGALRELTLDLDRRAGATP
jgi:hypothetical protein